MTQNLGLDFSETLLSNAQDSNFLPCPKIALYAGEKAGLGLCGICQVSRLTVRTEKQSLSGAALTVIPCGHIACWQCLEMCLVMKAECPFCRTRLEYEYCSHPLTGRVITRENLLSLPETLPMGGRIPDQCPECRIITNEKANRSILRSLSETFHCLRLHHRVADDRKKAAIRYRLQTMQMQFDLVAKRLSAEAVTELDCQW